jgi:multidrug transporter EmrE-like cation transporter
MPNVILVVVNLVATVAANALLKLSADAGSIVPFLLFQAAGNVLGLVGVLAYTGLLRTTPLHVSFPLTKGLQVIGVQVVAASVIFQEPVTPLRLAGTALVSAGIVVVGLAMGRPAERQ